MTLSDKCRYVRHPSTDKTRQVRPSANETICTECKNRIETAPNDSITRQIVNLFGGTDEFCKIPKLHFNSRFLGDGDGSIRITSTDLTRPLMIGIDSVGRMFVVWVKSTKQDNFVAILSQKYSNSEGFWELQENHSTSPYLGKIGKTPLKPIRQEFPPQIESSLRALLNLK